MQQSFAQVKMQVHGKDGPNYPLDTHFPQSYKSVREPGYSRLLLHTYLLNSVAMKGSDDFDWLALERLYEEGRQLFLCGRPEEAVGRFKRIYEDTLELRDVTEIVEDYYTLPRGQWVAKYQSRFQRQHK